MTEIERLAAKVANLERRMSGMMRFGTVDSVDPAGGTVRLKIGDGPDGPVLTGPVPYAQKAGAMKFHNPPSVGQQMVVMSPSGDMRHGVAQDFGWSDTETAPGSSGDDHVLTFGSLRISIKGDAVVLSLGGTSITLTASDVTINSGAINLN